LRYWVIEATNDFKDWDILLEHNNDASLHAKGMWATWKVPPPTQPPQQQQSSSSKEPSSSSLVFYRAFRIRVCLSMSVFRCSC
jgi:hypothetical protein